MKKYDAVLVTFDTSPSDTPVASVFTTKKNPIECLQIFKDEEAIELYNKLTGTKEEA